MIKSSLELILFVFSLFKLFVPIKYMSNCTIENSLFSVFSQIGWSSENNDFFRPVDFILLFFLSNNDIRFRISYQVWYLWWFLLQIDNRFNNDCFFQYIIFKFRFEFYSQIYMNVKSKYQYLLIKLVKFVNSVLFEKF